MKSFTVNTHHAYLNTDICIHNNTIKPIVVKDLTTSEEWHVNHDKLIRLSSGEHILESGDTKSKIIIEDAIKLGGSTIKKAFVFDDNPWVFLTTKDRFYAENMDTGEEKVEHCITPNTITSLGQYYGKPCEYFLFNTKKDYSIYNVETGKLIITFSDHIYSNNHLVIYRSDALVSR